MADTNSSIKTAGIKFWKLINLERKEVGYIYFFASLAGIIQLSLPLGIQAIIGLLYGGIVSASLVVLICFVVFGVIMSGVFQVMQMRVSEHIQQRIFARLTFAYADRLPKIDLLSVDKYYLPELVNRFFDTTTLQKGISKLLLDIPGASIQIVFGLILLSFYHPVFIAFGLVLLAVVAVIFYFTSPNGLRTSIEESDYKYQVAHWLEEISRAVKTFKFSQHSNLHLKKTDKLTAGYLEARDAHFNILVFQYRVLIAFKAIITTAMLIIGSLLLIRQQINLGQFVAAEIIIIGTLNSVEKLIVSLETVYDVLTAIEKLDKVLQKPDDPAKNDQLLLSEVAGKGPFSITVNNLKFGYPHGQQIIHNISFGINAGEKVCITGAEGAGKTTLLRILAGLYHHYHGSIAINGIPLQNVPEELWHSKVAVYFAREEVFSGSLWENLTLGNEAIGTNEVTEACELVGLSDFLYSCEEGYATILDPQGQKLSNSSVQKILMARCLLCKPSLLLLESGWQSIEQQYQQAIIDKLTGDRSFTLIAIFDSDKMQQRCDRLINLSSK
ncbi:ABC transporter ATP-binding protein/permease [Mucilaginibacter sp. RS28]|uniref:ABC transporter ATP-binding protein/permease n=1 Tax=Mucilaginibacter straminoryzae TaxID=2932774 RepID=A0A9X2BB89_9SPHI|nr:ABC transporter ATP-binding protein [Mucilaginibacter straminoryzae]MCJ8209582.1 ABC transporter ATP-binding protein/permease [Mucilaginibacter straminoryzae]